MDAQVITRAALGVLDEAGLDKLSMRLVAARLGVQVGGLYYYVADKAALLRAVADELCGQALREFADTPAGADWEVRAAGLCGCVRAVLNQHRDSARVLAASPLSGSVPALALMEELIGLLEGGIAAPRASMAADTLLAYVTGFVLQEQSAATGPFPLTMDELAARFPRVVAGAAVDDGEMFSAGVTSIVTGFSGQARTALSEVRGLT